MIKIYTDGGARGNPGPAAAGIAMFDENDILVLVDGKYLGETTNNQAEYKAIIEALKIAQRKKFKEAQCYLDSELIVKQIAGEYKVKNENIKPLKQELDTLINSFDSIKFSHVVREKNTIADKLVNIILDAVGSK